MDSKIFDTLLEPVFLLDQEGKTIYCNEPASLICDISARKIVRMHSKLTELFQFSDKVQHLDNMTSITDATPYQEVAFTTTSGKSGKVQITVQPFSENQWLVFFRDVTLEETLQKKYRAELEQKEDVILDLQKAQAELQNYSKNLEKMVAERTAELTRLNQMMGALLDSLGQGFFVFNQQGLCLEIFSKACEQTVECQPPGKKVVDVLKLKEQELPGFDRWLLTVFDEMLPFEDLAPLGPPSFPHSAGKHIKLEYYPLRAADNKIEGVVVVASDISDLVQAQKDAETERAHAKMILSLIKNKKEVTNFLREAEAILHELSAEIKKGPQFNAEVTFRCLHTLKGGAASFSIQSVVENCHQAESLLVDFKNTSDKDKVFSDLNQRAQLVEETFQSFLKESEAIIGSVDKLSQRWLEFPQANFIQFAESHLNHDLKLQKHFFNEFLTENIGDQFSQYQEVAQNVAEQEGKLIKPFIIEQAELKVFPDPYSQLFSTFIHAFRNAIDHGIETPSTREEKGKDPAGQIILKFSQESEGSQTYLLIKVIDDGGGIDPQKIRTKLKGKGIDVDKETDEQVIQHIFDSQFSTKEVVTSTSGRGVGMDAILSAAKKIGGTAWVSSRLNHGTELTVRVPVIHFELNKKFKVA